MIWKLPLHGQWCTVTTEKLKKFRDDGQKDIAEAIESNIFQYEQNKLAFFLPHGVPWRKKDVFVADGEVCYPACSYPKEWLNDGVAFLNDRTSTIAMVVAGNQNGKSTIAVVKTALHTIPCDKGWQIFHDHNVVWQPWEGPKNWVVASYSWDNVRTIWEGIRNFFPRSQLKNYAPNWGRYPGETGQQKDLSFGDGKPKDLLLECGSKIKFLCYTQQQMHWEGFTSDGLTADEQIPYEKFVGWARSTITRGDYTPCFMSLTGHVLDDRPDTGKSGWIYNDLWTGENTHGRIIGRYMLSVASTPDAIVSPVKKAELYRQFADPSVQRSEKQKRAAIARYWGGWEQGSGMVFDEWDRSIHVIDPLFDDDKVPRNWTKYRSIDFGDNNISCCVWLAVNPQGIAFVYRCLYERGMNIATLAREIITRSHNVQNEIGTINDHDNGAVYKLYEEVQSEEQFYTSVIDSRSAAQMKMGATLLNIFQRYGLELSPACGQKNAIQIPRLKDWLRIDYEKYHISRKDSEGKPMKGAPRMYFFDGRTYDAVREIETLQQHPEDPSKFALHQDDHACDSLKMIASENPAFYGDLDAPQDDTGEYVEPCDPVTGY